MYLFEFCKFFKKLLKYFTYAVCDFCTPSAYCPGECGERSVNIRNKNDRSAVNLSFKKIMIFLNYFVFSAVPLLNSNPMYTFLYCSSRATTVSIDEILLP